MVTQSRPTLILTRPDAASRRFAAEVEARYPGRFGFCIAPLMVPEFLAPALPRPPLDGFIFTSETGVEALRRLSAETGPAICVGPRTAQAAQQAGFQPEILGGDAEAMIAALTAAPRPGRWLHARGQDAITTLAERLTAIGMDVTERVVYVQKAQSPGPELSGLLTGDGPLVFAAFSPRSARIFAAAAGELPAGLQVASISAAAARAFAAQPLARIVVAPTPDGPGMLAALGEFLDPPATCAAARDV